MRFCMVATFYPPYHFGGDAMYVHRLANALARRGHDVDVIHDLDAYFLARSQPAPQTFVEHPRVRVHRMKSAVGPLSPLATQQTGRPWFKPTLAKLLMSDAFDVVHFHNPSLIGSSAFAYGDAAKLYTTHEHWLICPMHVLWKFNREPCDTPECLKCCLQGRRPPQLWRYTGKLARDLAHIDWFLSPSQFTLERHERAGLDLPMSVLPYFVPAPDPDADAPRPARPYFLFVGRLVALKGVDTLLRVFRRYTAADLLIVGDGDDAGRLKAMAADLPHVRFLGSRGQREIAALQRDAIALVMPSIGYEVFGIVLIEAFAVRTPVIVRNRGGMPEAVTHSNGGLLFDTEAELESALRTLQGSHEVRTRMGENGFRAYETTWSEAPHLDAYMAAVAEARSRRARRRRA